MLWSSLCCQQRLAHVRTPSERGIRHQVRKWHTMGDIHTQDEEYISFQTWNHGIQIVFDHTQPTVNSKWRVHNISARQSQSSNLPELHAAVGHDELAANSDYTPHPSVTRFLLRLLQQFAETLRGLTDQWSSTLQEALCGESLNFRLVSLTLHDHVRINTCTMEYPAMSGQPYTHC